MEIWRKSADPTLAVFADFAWSIFGLALNVFVGQDLSLNNHRSESKNNQNDPKFNSVHSDSARHSNDESFWGSSLYNKGIQQWKYGGNLLTHLLALFADFAWSIRGMALNVFVGQDLFLNKHRSEKSYLDRLLS